jgi:hypothetical protein
VPLRVECWAFGSPPVFAPLSAVPAACAETLRVFVHKHDVVPRLSLGSVSRLLLRVAAIDRQPWPMQRRVALALRQQHGGGGGGGGGTLTAAEVAALDEALRQEHERCRLARECLHLPGSVYWMHGGAVRSVGPRCIACAPGFTGFQRASARVGGRPRGAGDGLLEYSSAQRCWSR